MPSQIDFKKKKNMSPYFQRLVNQTARRAVVICSNKKCSLKWVEHHECTLRFVWGGNTHGAVCLLHFWSLSLKKHCLFFYWKSTNNFKTSCKNLSYDIFQRVDCLKYIYQKQFNIWCSSFGQYDSSHIFASHTIANAPLCVLWAASVCGLPLTFIMSQHQSYLQPCMV